MRECLETREACDMVVKQLKQIIQILPPLPLNSTIFGEKNHLTLLRLGSDLSRMSITFCRHRTSAKYTRIISWLPPGCLKIELFSVNVAHVVQKVSTHDKPTVNLCLHDSQC